MADTKEIIDCPACGKRMEKIYIERINKHIDICSQGCGGIFFDNREMEHFCNKNDNIDEILAIYENKDFKTIPDDKEILCPYCGAKMVKIGNGTADESFKIDCCYTCGAKFLNGYELQKLQNAPQFNEDVAQKYKDWFMSMYGEDMDRLNEQYAKIKPDKNFIRNLIKSYISSH